MDLGQNYHIWSFGAQNAKIGITLVKNHVKKSFWARWKRFNKAVLVDSKFLIFNENSGTWGKITIFGHSGPKMPKLA